MRINSVQIYQFNLIHPKYISYRAKNLCGILVSHTALSFKIGTHI